MSVTFPDNFHIDAWYRGTKNVKVVQCHDKFTLLSNGDKFTKQGNEIYLNGKLLTNMPNISPEDLVKIYTYYLKKKGYKILENKIRTGEKFLNYMYEEENFDDHYYFKFLDSENYNSVAYCTGEQEWNCYWHFEDYFTENEYRKFFPSDMMFNLQELVTLTDFREEGLGTQLMKKAIEKAKQLGNDRMYLNASPLGYYTHTLTTSQLVKFYQKFGFEVLIDQGKNVRMFLDLTKSVNENNTATEIEYHVEDEPRSPRIIIKAFDESGVIGTCYCIQATSFIIEEILVEEQYRTKGIARQMMMLAETKAKELGYDKIILEAKTNIHENGIPQDKLEAFYRSCGFKYDYSTKRKIMYKTI
jgi:GNAT superfamily N-acetyltransferase